MKKFWLLTGVIFLFSCTSKNTKQVQDTAVKTKDSVLELENKIYLKIDELHSGPVFTGKDKASMFYRVLVIPQEENIMLMAELISIGEEDGNYHLVKRIRLTDDNAVIPKFGLSSIDSIKFIDTARFSAKFNDKKRIVNLQTMNTE